MVIVLTAADGGGGEFTEVTVLPFTHRAPDNSDWAIEIPAPVKRHLGLDDARSWVIGAEGNDVRWPGYDLRRVTVTDRYDYGFLPPRVFNRIIGAFDRLRRSRKVRLASRA